MRGQKARRRGRLDAPKSNPPIPALQRSLHSCAACEQAVSAFLKCIIVRQMISQLEEDHKRDNEGRCLRGSGPRRALGEHSFPSSPSDAMDRSN